MTARDDDRDSLPLTLLERIVSVCDRFEQEWKAGRRPSIEQFLLDDPDREVLLARLLLLELELRRQAGDTPRPEDYRERFAGSSTLIDAVFAGGPDLSVPTGETVVRSCETIAATGSIGLESTEGPRRSGISTIPNGAPEPRPGTVKSAGPRAGERSGEGPSGGRFTLVRKHARGGVGEVWLARDHALGRDVALKRLLSVKAGDPTVRARFYREAWITGQLQHPGVVPVYELALNEGDHEPYYTMRFIKGRTLSETVRAYHDRRKAGRAGRHELRELVGVFLNVCQIVAYAHSRGVIHRDLKGQNVALGDYGEVMLLDWGMAKVVGEPETGPDLPAVPPSPEAPEAASATVTGRPPDSDWEGTDDGSVLGTPGYMSPEQAQGRLADVDVRSDVYGLGAVLYEILTGEPPFRGPRRELLRRVIHDVPVPPRQINPDAPPALEAVCLKCLSKDASARYASAAELAREIQRFQEDEPVAAFPEPWTGRVRRLISRHQTVASVVLATLLVTTICLAAATALLKLANDRASRALSRAESNESVALKAVYRLYSMEALARQLKARGLEKLHRDLLAEAKQLLAELPTHEGAGPRVLFERGWGDLRLARITEELGEPAESIRLASRALETFKELAGREPGKQEYREGIARALDALGSHHAANHQPEEARRVLNQAVAAWEELLRQHPSVHEFRQALVSSLNHLGRILCLVQHNQEEARKVLRRTLELCDQATGDKAGAEDFRAARADAMVLLGYSLALTDFAAARPLLDQGLTLREELAAGHPESFELQSDLLDACVLIATAYSNARIAGEVPKFHEKVRRIGERLSSEHPDVPRFAENRGLIELIYCIHLAQAGSHAEATANAEQTLERIPQSGLALLYGACCFSLASEAARRGPANPASEELVRRDQERAIELLRQAGRTGLFQQPHHFEGVKEFDPDLAPLRQLESFQRMIQEFEPQPAPK